MMTDITYCAQHQICSNFDCHRYPKGIDSLKQYSWMDCHVPAADLKCPDWHDTTTDNEE